MTAVTQGNLGRGVGRPLRYGGGTNVLLCSVGRRSYLVHYFRQALQGKGLVIATNSTADSTGMAVADQSVVISPASDDQYLTELMGVCVKYRIKLLLSLHDWEAPFIAANLKKFRSLGVIPVVSKPAVIKLCLDKILTCMFAKRNGIAHPFTVSNLEEARKALRTGQLKMPLIMKPRFGQGSIGVETVRDKTDLAIVYRLLMKRIESINSNRLLTAAGKDSLLFQEMIEGEEFGLDVVNDLNGKFSTCLVKRKIAMRSGETDAAETVQDNALEEVGRRIGTALGHVGLLDVDIIVRAGIPYLLEMNPRFGGHYPFSHMAGANIPAALLAWAQKRKPRPEWLRVKPGIQCFKDIQLLRVK